MGCIKEPKGVDFVVAPTKWTKKEKREVSAFIKKYKLKQKQAEEKKKKRATLTSFPS